MHSSSLPQRTLRAGSARGVTGALLASLLAFATPARAADPHPTPLAIPETPSPFPSAWQLRFTPYGWLTSLNGSQTVRGRTVKVNASFVDIVEETIGSGGTLIGLMGNAEARKGPVALFGDLVWAKIGVSEQGARTKSFAPGIAGALGASAKVGYEMAIVEAGAAYEIVGSNAPFGVVGFDSVALDVLVGGRFWHQKANVSLDIATALDVGDLELRGNRAIARSGSVEWADPFIGARVRLATAPGHEIFLRGDVGGFRVGSRFSWQAIAGYAADIAVCDGFIVSGIAGYRALAVDYAQGEGRRRYQYDMIQHGPLLGVSLRW